MLSWLYDALRWVGIFNKRARLLVVGLDNAGKTTLLHLLIHNHLGVHPPTVHPRSEDMASIEGVTFKAVDLGGHARARVLWKEYEAAADAIVFVVDATCVERLGEAKAELTKFLADQEHTNMPVLVLGNKIDDTARAISETHLRQELGIHEGASAGGPARPVQLFMCSVVRRYGYLDGLRWLAKQIA